MESNVLGKRMASQAEEDKEDGEGEQPEGQDPAVAGVSARWVRCVTFTDLNLIP